MQFGEKSGMFGEESGKNGGKFGINTEYTEMDTEGFRWP
jgi:hypothetical protein